MPERNQTDDRYWHWGGLYYSNPDDPARWVEKRVGAGPTPNMAHLQGKVIFICTILFLMAALGGAAYFAYLL